MSPIPRTRRQFIASSAGTVAGLLVAPRVLSKAIIHREGGPRFLLGLAAYSLRDYMKHGTHARSRDVEPSRLIDMRGFIDYVADLGFQGAELTSYYFSLDVSDEQLFEIRRHAFLRGVEISGSAVGNTFALPSGPELESEIRHVLLWIDRCAALGAPHLRVFAGSAKGISESEAIRQCVAALKRCADHAARKGVILGIENHGGIVSQAAVLEEIVNSADHDWLGINLDTGNFYSAHPYDDLARLAPYAVNVQLKVEINSQPGGKQPTDFPRIFETLRRANYQGYVTLEYEAADDPLVAIPGHLAALRKLL